MPGAVDLLRSLRDAAEDPEVAVLAATDPANPYGATLPWPKTPDTGRGPTRSVGATVILVDGALAAYVSRGDRLLLTFLPEAEPQRSKMARAVARALADRYRAGMLIEEIDGTPSTQHPLATVLGESGFVSGAMGMQRSQQSTVHSRQPGRTRPTRSTVSSPFARRYYGDGTDE
jgi:ATP-dependent Lhr-like helicase